MLSGCHITVGKVPNLQPHMWVTAVPSLDLSYTPTWPLNLLFGEHAICPKRRALKIFLLLLIVVRCWVVVVVACCCVLAVVVAVCEVSSL